jgi:hypothetical protein
MMQMFGAVVAIVLLVTTGLTTATIVATAATTSLTLLRPHAVPPRTPSPVTPI